MRKEKSRQQSLKQSYKLWALDTEDNSQGEIYLINFFDGETHYTFDNQSEAIEFLETLEGRHHFWACNMGYDLPNTFGDALKLLSLNFSGSRLINANLPETGLKFYCTLNQWKMSVEKMGERINLPKLKVDGKFNNIDYCKRDTEIVYFFVKHMKEAYEKINAKLKSTIASTSLEYFENNFHHKLDFSYIEPDQLDFMLKGYYGGRTEIFFNKPIEGCIQYYDFNSLYPSVMSENKYPIIKYGKYGFVDEINLENEGLADVTVRSPDDLYIPYLPYRDDSGRLMFPLGEFRGHYSYFELREAQKIGYKIIKTHRALEFWAGLFEPFKGFVKNIYTLREKSKKDKDDFMSETAKGIMNNLYGKFGQGNELTKLVPYKKGKLKQGDILYSNGMVFKKYRGPYPKHSNMIWAAYTTAFARHKLYNALKKLHDEKALIIYCDTDSVIFESSKTIFKNSLKLGELKCEGVFKYAHFKLPKQYVLIDADNKKEYKTKGVPKAQAGEFFESGKVKYKKPLKIKEVLRRNLSPKNKHKLLKINYWTEVEKINNKQYDKRRVRKNGQTDPITIVS